MLIILIISCTNIEDTVEHDTVMSDVVPVIIIGGGASGLSVGIRLLELGISPLLLEKEAELGGAGIHAGRFFAVDTQLQKSLNILIFSYP